jgi:hypothetical protein
MCHFEKIFQTYIPLLKKIQLEGFRGGFFRPLRIIIMLSSLYPFLLLRIPPTIFFDKMCVWASAGLLLTIPVLKAYLS